MHVAQYSASVCSHALAHNLCCIKNLYVTSLHLRMNLDGAVLADLGIAIIK